MYVINTADHKIFVECLATRNAGRQTYGVWIDLDFKDENDIDSEIRAMLISSPNPNTTVECPKCEACDDDCERCNGSGEVASAESWIVTAYDCEDIDCGEYPDLERLAEIVDVLNSSPNHEAFAVWLNEIADESDPLENFENEYRGEYSTAAEYVESYYRDNSPEFFKSDSMHPSNYVDWELLAESWQTLTIESGFAFVRD